MKIRILTRSVLILLFAGAMFGAFAAEGDAYTWPTYSSKLNYSFKDAGITYSKPTKDVSGTCVNAAKSANGVYHGNYWAFYHGANKNSLVTEASITPMLARFDKDFSYITDTLGWPRDSRVKDGYYSSIYLYGSDACTGSNSPLDSGGWQSSIDGYPAVAASFYPVYSYDPNCPYGDKVSQQGAMIHEGIHAILTNLGAAHVHWFQEGGNTWLQQEMEVRRSTATQYSGMGFLNVGNLMAPFVPIESYSGWLLDGSFGGPGAEGVDAGQGICNWRKTLGGVQYGNLFPTFLGLWVAEGAVPWIWVSIPNYNGQYILESMAAAIGGSEVRSIIMEYRAKLAMLDMKKWSEEMRSLLNQQVGGSIGCEWTPCAVNNVASWTVTPYVVTTESNGVLTPEARTTPGWSGANVIPLTINSGATQVKLSLQNASTSMGLQIAYRATDGTPIYSTPIFGNNQVVLNLSKAPQGNVVFAIITNTDYDYVGDVTRTTHHSYQLKLDAGISAKADPYTKWYDNFNLDYDWDNAKIVTSTNSSSSVTSNSSSSGTSSSSSVGSATTITYNVNIPISNDYSGTSINVDFDPIASGLGISASEITASMIQGVNADGSLSTGNTAAGDAGHWFAANGDVVSWNETTAYIFAEWTISSKTVKIGHYPNKVLDGETYVVRQAVSSGTKQMIVEYKVSIGTTTIAEGFTDWRKDLDIAYKNGLILANYNVEKAGKVKVAIYTGFGALIQNVVNEYQPIGTYSKQIDLKAMGLPKGVYLIRLSYPGHSETRASISSYK
ncbi:MAG: hypothetical protein AUK31_07090 [Fibrobacteres bacterium CG2_30_45_31]|nr:MAG: hypothetical protein AUK31_07090 [Fibrobacteres bacterium CG2_30_45_31]